MKPISHHFSCNKIVVLDNLASCPWEKKDYIAVFTQHLKFLFLYDIFKAQVPSALSDLKSSV